MPTTEVNDGGHMTHHTVKGGHTRHLYAMASPLGRIYRTPALSPAALGRAVTAANAASLGATTRITSATSEFVFYVQREAELTPESACALTRAQTVKLLRSFTACPDPRAQM